MASSLHLTVILLILTTMCHALQLTQFGKRDKETIDKPDFNSVLRYLLSNLKSKVLRDRRGSVDFGLMSRHLAGSDYARVAETRQHILNPYGPGKRKRTMRRL